MKIILSLTQWLTEELWGGSKAQHLIKLMVTHLVYVVTMLDHAYLGFCEKYSRFAPPTLLYSSTNTVIVITN